MSSVHESPQRRRSSDYDRRPDRRRRSGAAASKTRRRRPAKRRRRGGWLYWFIPLVLLLAAGAFWVHHEYLFLDGALYRRDTESFDLRGERVSVESYETLRNAFPDSEILWSVPVGNASYDCRADSILLTEYPDGEEANLSYLPALRTIDATSAALTEEQYEKLRAAAPQADIFWCVPLGGNRYADTSESIAVGDFSAEEVSLFRYFRNLSEVDARSSSSYDAIRALKTAYPALDVQWQIPLSGQVYDQDATELSITDPATSVEELTRALDILPDVRSVTAEESSWTDEQKMSLAERYPQIAFSWPVSLRGEKQDSGTETLSFAGQKLSEGDIGEMIEKLKYFPELKSLDLTGCGLDNETIYPLCDAYPTLDVIWDFELYGKKINTLAEELDFTGIEMESAEEVDRIIPYMHHLKKVDMSDTGLGDKELDKLNKKYEGTRVVWTLHITAYKIRTDAIGFRATSNHYGTFTDKSVQRLKYCEDMIALDLGHRPITNLNFLYDMPKIKYLILLDNHAPDLTPVGALPNLIWLELNRANIPSIAPLKECKSLRDLNITFMGLVSQEDTFETLMEMDWLEKVWFSRPLLTPDQEAKLQAAHPNCNYHVVYIWDQSNEDPWRYDQDYYDMRDALGNMFYMNGTGAINYKIIDGVRYELDPEFLASQDHGEHDRDRS